MVEVKARRDWIFIALTVVVGVALLVLPSPSRSPYAPGTSEWCVGRVVDVNNSVLRSIGPVKDGEQQLELLILTGRFKGRRFESSNNLYGKIELDKLFAVGDRAFVVLDLSPDGKDVAYANAIDHFRLDTLAILGGLFAAFLLIYAGRVGLKTVLSFAFAAIVMFKVLLPAWLLGWAPVPITLAVVSVLAASILFLVAGINRTSLTALLGAAGGFLFTAVLAGIVTRALKLHGATRPFMEALLYSGYSHLDIRELFIAGIFLASSGAVVDLAMDISAAMSEVAAHREGLGRTELLRSGLKTGRLVIGTQTATLLFAYSAGYSGMLMNFIAQGLPTANCLNLVYVASELAHTLVGCFGLVVAAPLTALAGALLLGANPESRNAAGATAAAATGVAAAVDTPDPAARGSSPV